MASTSVYMDTRCTLWSFWRCPSALEGSSGATRLLENGLRLDVVQVEEAAVGGYSEDLDEAVNRGKLFSTL